MHQKTKDPKAYSTENQTRGIGRRESKPADRERIPKKIECLGCRAGKREKVIVISELRRKYSLEKLLITAKIPRSSYYYHHMQLDKPDKHRDEREAIQQICVEHKGRYGYRRVTLELRHRGFGTNHKLVMRLMKQEHLTCMQKQKKYRSYRGEVGIVAPNLLDRDFKAQRPNSKWVTDITEFKLLGQRIYLSPILDLFNGEIISYTISTSPNFRQVTEMLKSAFQKVPDNCQILLHSDQGWQYRMREFQQMVKDKGLQQSMSRKGNCYDNSVMENFFGILKTEFFHHQKFASVDLFIKDLSEYIEYYNNIRIKVKLNGLSPVQYRAQSVSPN